MTEQAKFIMPKAQTDGAVLIVLAAGAVTQDFVSVVNSTTPAMLPYMGRPLIYQVIVNHIKRHGQDVIIALPDNEPRLEDFLQTTFGARVNLILTRITPDNTNTPVTSLHAALTAAVHHGLAQKAAFIVHGDIYFEAGSEIATGLPTVFVDTFVESDKYSYFAEHAGRWTYHPPLITDRTAVETDLRDRAVTDIGAYWVPAINEVIAGSTRNALVTTVGDLLSRVYPDNLQVERVSMWSDLGHLDTATQIRTRLIGAREFNSLSIDEARGLITKRSKKKDKILQELNYYSHLPPDLSIYFPRLHDFAVGREVSYTLEYYSYRTLAEYLVFFSFPPLVWQKIIERLLDIHGEFRTYRGADGSKADVNGFYLGKLLSRMDDLQPGTPIHHLVSRESVVINGRPVWGYRRHLPRVTAAINAMAEDVRTSIIHGDLCFSNILYDPQTGLIKLIDPRGEFFREGCYGDPRYDLAKLLHSFHGGYDFIMQEMYELSQVDHASFKFRLFRPEASKMMASSLVDWLDQHVDYKIKDLLLLEALLFLSMLPLHSDDPQRQMALYLTGILILEEVFDADLH